MDNVIRYKLVPLAKKIHAALCNNHPYALAIANYDSSLQLTYKGRHYPLDAFHLHLTDGSRFFDLSHQSSAPFFFMLLQEAEDAPLEVILYTTGPNPLLESTGEYLAGHLLAYSFYASQGKEVLIHAVTSPKASHIFSSLKNRRSSVLLESSPEVCQHMLLCGSLTEHLLDRLAKGGVQNE